MRIIGDVHGKFEKYCEKIVDYKGKTLQVGDMGIGFGPILPKRPANNFFIRGNHDDPALCQKHPNYAGEFGYWDDEKLFFIGGAYSIDINYRLQFERMHGRKIWWPDEQLSLVQLEQAYELYKEKLPQIVISHDCPGTVGAHLLDELTVGFRPEKKIQTQTGDALDRMFRLHQPNMWIFGHYHIDKQFEFGNTKFICLNELSYIDLEC